MRKLFVTIVLFACALTATAQSIDLNKVNTGQETSVEEPGYVQWNIGTIPSDTKTLDNGLILTIAAVGNSTVLKGDWHKNTCNWGKNNNLTGNRFLGDGAIAYIATKDAEGTIEDPTGTETPLQKTRPMSIAVTIQVLSVGHHT